MQLGKASHLYQNPAVQVSAFGDVIKIWLWTFGSLVIGRGLTLVAFNIDKALFEIFATKDFNGEVEKITALSGGRLRGFDYQEL